MQGALPKAAARHRPAAVTFFSSPLSLSLSSFSSLRFSSPDPVRKSHNCVRVRQVLQSGFNPNPPPFRLFNTDVTYKGGCWGGRAWQGMADSPLLLPYIIGR